MHGGGGEKKDFRVCEDGNPSGGGRDESLKSNLNFLGRAACAREPFGTGKGLTRTRRLLSSIHPSSSRLCPCASCVMDRRPSRFWHTIGCVKREISFPNQNDEKVD